MAVRPSDWSPGEILTASDLNDSLASKLPYSYGTATPSTTDSGFLWYDSNSTPAAPKFWDGAAFQPLGGSGKILQVVSTAKTDTAALSTTTQTWSSDVMTASITPSATSSQIWVTGFLMMSSSDTVIRNHVRLLRDASPIGVADAASNRALATSVTWGDLADVAHSVTAPFGYLDSPSSTSALTYSVQMYNSSGITRTLYVNRSSGDADTASVMRGISVLTLMEVSG